MQLNLNKLEGTEFQKKVWKEIYKMPKSFRAVANACGKNPFPITIPCHRVIKSDGSIGGYSAKGGVRKKKALLSKESNE